MHTLAQLNTMLAGRYVVEREIGAGGMATVYLARDLKHDRPVALKLLKPELGAVLGVERFLSEIRVTANLQHPHLLPLFDSGEADGQLFYVMPYVEGESLRARLDRERQLPIADAVRITVAVLAALDYAHAHGVIHRDLKPENILVQHGEPVIADFGIALAVSNAGGQRITQTGLSLGTPQYMSPEQATGDRTIDARSDLYSVGAMLYEMLAGEPPHVGGTVQAVIAKVITERPRSLRAARDTVPESLDAAVLKALAKLPADRWASAREFADALGAGSSATIARHAGPGSMLAARVRRLARSAGFWRGAAVALLVIAAGLAWMATHPRGAPPELQMARQLTFDGDVVGAAISADGAWLAYVTNECFGKDVVCPSTLQVREVDGTQSVKLVTWPLVASNIRWSPDGATVGFVGSADSAAASLYLVPRLGGVPQRVGPAPIAWTFAPDGRVVEAVGPEGRQAMIWIDAHTLARSDSAALPVGFTFDDLDFRRDGSRIAARAATPQAALLLLDARGRLLDSSTTYYIRPEVRWDATQSAILVVGIAPGVADNLRRIPVVRDRLRVDASTIALGEVHDGADGFMDVARTGRVVIVGGPSTFEIQTLRIDAAARGWTPVTHRTSWVWANAVAPDATSIVGSATDNVGENVYVFPLDGSPARAVTALHGIRDYPFWSPDGRHLAYNTATSDGTLGQPVFVDVAGGRERSIAVAGPVGNTAGWISDAAILLDEHVKLAVVDTLGRVLRQIPLGDSLRIASNVALDAARGRAAYWSQGSNALVTVDVTGGRVVQLWHPPSPMLPLGWGADGSLFVATAVGKSAPGAREGALNAATRRDLVLERLAPGSTSPVFVAALPDGCWLDHGAAIVGGGGKVAACTVRRYGPDVWLADRGGKSGW